MKKSVGILGPKGTNGHEAAIHLLGQLNEDDISFFGNHVEILEGIQEKRIDLGVVAMYNTSAGHVEDSFSFWLRQNGIFESRGLCPILELNMPINHLLLAHPQAPDDQKFTTVYSHDQGFNQCRQAIRELGLEKKPALSTADAARIVAESKPNDGCLAIASKFTAEMYGLKTIRQGVHDKEGNETTFHLIGQEVALATSGCKTAAIIWLKDEPASLFRTLAFISCSGRNMSMLKDIPCGSRNEKAFYVEFDGHLREERTNAILTLIKAQCIKMVILGSFPELLYL